MPLQPMTASLVAHPKPASPLAAPIQSFRQTDARRKRLARDKGILGGLHRRRGGSTNRQADFTAENLATDGAIKDFSALRAVVDSFHKRIDNHDAINPFGGLTFPKTARPRNKRGTFSTNWVQRRFLHGDGLAALNPEAWRVLFVMCETGARPSEICNLLPEAIRLDDDVPHMVIEHRQGRELKSGASERSVPLVGVALAAMKAQPNGFPRYFDREDSLSAALMKFLRAHGLLETPSHKVYSIRHSYIDRLREAEVSDDLRRAIVGHEAGDVHSGYGSGFTLKRKAEIMRRIALPFDRNVV